MTKYEPKVWIPSAHKEQPDCLGIGIDPDLHRPSAVEVARYENDYVVVGVRQYRVPENLKGAEAVAAFTRQLSEETKLGGFKRRLVSVIAAEGQQSYLTGAKRAFDTQDLLWLAYSGGVFLAYESYYNVNAEVLIPRPQQWKGTVPKQIHQNRVMAKLFWDPSLIAQSSRIAWSHVIDAAGLAIWGLQQLAPTRKSG